MKGIQVLLCIMVLCLFLPLTAYAEEIVSRKEPLDIIFVIDCSGSMKTNDPSKMGLNMVQAFVDSVLAEDVRIGYVAYNHDIYSFSAPESVAGAERREALKEEIGAITYSGDTDIGLGLSYAYELLPKENYARQMMVLISDGETDLPAGNQRTQEQSARELDQCVLRCREEDIPIYTVAFGQYDGNTAALEEIAVQTGAKSYSAGSPENLIEVLYGIFQDNLSYRIWQFSNGIYGGGSQEIRCILDAPYLDEINVLLLSSDSVGETWVQCGEEEILLANLSHYAVGKIDSTGTDTSAKELVIRSETKQGQNLQIYVIGYRDLEPVLNINGNIGKNQIQEYQVYFKNENGEIINDAAFYKTFSWELEATGTHGAQGTYEIMDGVLQGNMVYSHSGTYTLDGVLADDFGSYPFAARVEVENTLPSGSIPEEKSTLLDGSKSLCLDDYFTDKDGDRLLYSITEGQTQGVSARLEGNLLTITPESVGTHMVMIQVSDGEGSIQYVYRVEVIALWQAYWWVIAIGAAVLALILWRLTHKPRPELERLTEEKKQYGFSGRLDAYFVLQPQDEQEIPPLSFQMNRVKDSRVSLGALFGAYPEQAKALQLEEIYLIADENHSMILYHRSKSGVMVGNAIACMQIQYKISFGDIIYISSADGRYDLEIHYIAVFQ
nr:vWA domain-containing protein [uncultured Acetatifactor sp.]